MGCVVRPDEREVAPDVRLLLKPVYFLKRNTTFSVMAFLM